MFVMHILIIMKLPENEESVVSVCIIRTVVFVCYVSYYLKSYMPRTGQ